VSDSASIVTDEEVAVIMGPGGRRSAAHVAALAPVRQYPAAAHLAAGRPRFGLCCERLHQSRVYLATNVSQFGQIALTRFCINDLFTPAANRRGRKLGLSL
jgi:hypothetical protein